MAGMLSGTIGDDGSFAGDPDITNVGRAAGLLLSPLTGAWLGNKIGKAFPAMSGAKRAITYLSAGTGGALEGGLGAYLPTLEDVGMPEGTQAKAQADAHNSDPRFWALNVAPEAGAGAVASMLGAKYGLTAALPRAPASAGLPAAAAAPAQAAAKAPVPKLVQDASGRWRVVKGDPSGLGGKWAAAPPSGPASR